VCLHRVYRVYNPPCTGLVELVFDSDARRVLRLSLKWCLNKCVHVYSSSGSGRPVAWDANVTRLDERIHLVWSILVNTYTQ